MPLAAGVLRLGGLPLSGLSGVAVQLAEQVERLLERLPGSAL